MHLENDVPIQIEYCRPKWAVCAKQLSLQSGQEPPLFFCHAENIKNEQQSTVNQTSSRAYVTAARNRIKRPLTIQQDFLTGQVEHNGLLAQSRGIYSSFPIGY